MRKLNLLIISSSSKTGGGPTHVFLLKKIISHKVNIFFAMPKFKSLENNINTKNFISIDERKISIRDIFRLIKFVNNHSIDIIHAHGKGASLIGRILKTFTGKILVYTFHGIHIECLNPIEKFIYIYYERILGWVDDHKIFVSKSEYKKAVLLNFPVGNNFSIINNGVVNKLNKYISRNKIDNIKLGINNLNKNIISVCRLVDQKNIFEIVKIAKELPSYNFLIIGDGELFFKLKKYIKLSNIKNVYILGEKKDVYKYLIYAEIFLSTSLYEGHPISILEAMSIGLPIVASNVIGNVNTIDHGISGFFYQLGNIKMAANLIEKLISNKEKRLSFSRESFIKQRKFFSIENMKYNYINLYEKLFIERNIS